MTATSTAALFTRALAGDRLLIIRIESVYGRKVIYPVNAAAIAIAKIAGTKTLTLEVLATARDVLGFEVAEDPRPRIGEVTK